MGSQKPIIMSTHALGYVQRRGFSVQEVTEAIRSAPWSQVAPGRWECRHDFAFDAEWNGRMYATKQVRPIFVDEPAAIVVVTVYTYYF